MFVTCLFIFGHLNATYLFDEDTSGVSLTGRVVVVSVHHINRL